MNIPKPNEFAQQGGFKPFPLKWERWLSSVREAIVAAQPIAGRNVTTDVHPGQGTVVNAPARRASAGNCCNRDITEISAFCMDGLYINDCGFAGVCGNSCFEVYERINRADTFTDPFQFKLYLDEDCNVVFDVNSPPIQGSCTPGAFVGTTSFSIVWTGLTAAVNVHARADPSACGIVEADENFSVDVTLCDFSALLGTYSCSNFVPGVMSVAGVVFVT